MAEKAINRDSLLAPPIGMERRAEGGERAPSRKSRGLRIVWFLPGLDALCILTSLTLAYILRFKNPWVPYHATYSLSFYLGLVPWVVLSWLGLFALYRLYDRRLLFGSTEEYAAVINACTAGMIAVIFYDFLRRDPESVLSRGWVLLVWGLSILTIGLARFAFRRVVYHLRREGRLSRRVLIVGANNEARLIVDQFRNTPTAGVEVVGVVQDGMGPEAFEGVEDLPILGTTQELERLVEEYQTDELLIVPSALDRETFLDIYRAFGANSHGVELSFSPGLFELFTTRVQAKQVGFVPLINLNKLRITGVDAFLKRALDYGAALVGLLLLAPAFLVIAVLIKRDSPGPVFYRRRVLGLGGTTFDALKFRTMVVNADEVLERYPELKRQFEDNYKLKEDPRVTRVGRFLRRYSLDELPQLINVLRGQMSLVGPRMITAEEQERYGMWGMNLLTVKPGITGLWQVSGRADVSYEERVRLDMYYIRNYTIWLDLRLLFQTVPAVLQARGAY